MEQITFNETGVTRFMKICGTEKGHAYILYDTSLCPLCIKLQREKDLGNQIKILKQAIIKYAGVN